MAERVWWAGSANVGGFMNRFDQVASWVVVAVFGAVALVAAGGVGLWWFRATVIAPSCGDIAVAQLNAAVEEMHVRIPSLRFDGLGDSCDSGGEVYAVWEHDDLKQLLSEAAATGCRLNEPDSSEDDDDEEESLTCPTSRRDVTLAFELGITPLEGSLTLS